MATLRMRLERLEGKRGTAALGPSVIFIREGETGEPLAAMLTGGATTALRLCLERIAPPRKETPVQFDIPSMKSAADAAAGGELTPTEGAHIMALVEGYRPTLETSELETRLEAHWSRI